MSNKKFTDQEIIKLHKEYLNLKTLSILAFAKMKQISASALRSGYLRLGLEIISQSITRRKFPINESFFENIDSEEKAYILGFLYADGCNYEKNHKIEISLAKQDKDILEKISKIILYGKIDVKEYEDRVGLYIINNKISLDLKRRGCGERKTFTLQFPFLSKNLISHFMRGYFDGDGMLTINERIFLRCKNKQKSAEFSITSTKEMLDEMGKIISDLNVNFKINKRHKDRENNNFTLRVFGNQQIKKVCDFLYKDSSIYLDRKYLKYLELVEMSKSFRKEYNYV